MDPGIRCAGGEKGLENADNIVILWALCGYGKECVGQEKSVHALDLRKIIYVPVCIFMCEETFCHGP